MICAVADDKKRGRADDEPPYGRYAFLNPYNLSLLVGAGTAAAATGHWWIAVCAAATETCWPRIVRTSNSNPSVAPGTRIG